MKSIKINNMPDLPYAMEEAVNRLRINISFLGTKIKKIMIISTLSRMRVKVLLPCSFGSRLRKQARRPFF